MGAPPGSAREGVNGDAHARRSVYGKGGVALLLTVAGLAFGGPIFAAARALTAELGAMGATGELLFVAAYAASVPAFVPGWCLTFAAGAVFPFVDACVVSLVGATAGSALAFLVARRFVRDDVERRLARAPRLVALDDALAQRGALTVFLLRLSPLLPFNLLNYLLGVTRVSFRDFLLGSLGKIPGAVLYVRLGRTVADVGDLALGRGSRTPFEWGVLAFGLAATVAVTAYLTVWSSRALAKASRPAR